MIWSQSRGALETVEGVFLGQGYSGAGWPGEKDAGRNNPAREGEKDVGPIPQGNWRIEKVADEKYRGRLTPPVFRLVPQNDGTLARVKAMGRNPDAFFVRGENVEDPGCDGFIVLDYTTRAGLRLQRGAVIRIDK